MVEIDGHPSKSEEAVCRTNAPWSPETKESLLLRSDTELVSPQYTGVPQNSGFFRLTRIAVSPQLDHKVKSQVCFPLIVFLATS